MNFARIRPPAKTVALLRPIVDEAWTLVRLHRGARDVAFTNAVPADMEVFADADRLTQVLVNLVRNAVGPGAGLLLTDAFYRSGLFEA